MVKNHKNPLTPIAQKLRKKSTPAERKLWNILRKNQLAGCHFTRQHPINPYIVDFCCRSKHLIIEIDGDIHAMKEQDDLIREQFLRDSGYNLIRFTNRQVLYDLDAVVLCILETLESK